MLGNKCIVRFDVFISLTVFRCSQASPQLIQIFYRALWREDKTFSLTIANEFRKTCQPISREVCRMLNLFTDTLQGSSIIN